jgi:hypothetical protein
MECVKNPGCNCEKGCKCPSGYECCTQNGNKGRLGLCVKRNQCDKSRGIPQKGCKDPSNKFTPSSEYENFTVFSREGYGKDQEDCDCSNWNHAFMILFIVIVVLVFLVASLYLSSAKIR